MPNNIPSITDLPITKRRNWLLWYVCFTFAMVLFLFGLIMYWLFFPYNTTTYSSEPFKMDKTTYVQGEDAHYHVSYCKGTDVVPTIKRYFIDGLKIEASENQANFTQGCHDNQEIHFLIPRTLPPGHWQLEVVATYKFNPLRAPIVNTHVTEWFNVTRSDAGAYGATPWIDPNTPE